MQKYALRTGRNWCESCRAPRRRFIKYVDGSVCEAWQGDFDELENPVRDGLLVLPGTRTCGHTDCVAVNHVVGAVAKPVKRGRPAKPVDPDAATVKAIIERRLNRE